MDTYVKKLSDIKDDLLDPDIKFDSNSLRYTIERVIKIVDKKFGSENEYSTRLSKINQNGFFFEDNQQKLISILDIIIDDIELSSQKEEFITKPNQANDISERMNKLVYEENHKVFVVHGHNNEIKQSVARIIDKLGLEPIILHEQPNMGMTIIEKFLFNSNVGFAVVILSADDIVFDSNNKQNYRARQNVVLELGFFYAKLGRNRVVALVDSSKKIDLPSDIHGIIYISYDGDNGRWKFDLAKELSNNGYSINVNDIL
ncbi:TIR domain-containing protein [Paludibacter jiangxiensis]|uniref:Predicted nucleotide-binding protein n=1 Tax=Paludibacter jiangxiensis TaxID=681398 RepID=A0A170ZCT2_9BACT|nr:nucleotide-binding protein [Paludibacter jiangxiensis]GAT62536.1 predicted nucleotide-binding protein [Paludibacter jiangxiensis]